MGTQMQWLPVLLSGEPHRQGLEFGARPQHSACPSPLLPSSRSSPDVLSAFCKHTRGGFAATAFAQQPAAQQGKGSGWDMCRDPCGVGQVPVSKESRSLTQGQEPRGCLLRFPPEPHLGEGSFSLAACPSCASSVTLGSLAGERLCRESSWLLSAVGIPVRRQQEGW